MQAAQGYRWGLKAAALLLISTVLSGCGINTIPTLDEQAKAAWGQVQNQYQRRADLIPNLVEVVKGYATHEQDTLTAVIEARAKATSIQVDASTLDNPEKLKQFQQAQDGLSGALSRLMVVSERYPDLKANQNFLALQSQLEGTENRIAVARGRYVKAVQDYNVAVRSFPSNLTAMVFGYKPKPNFTVENEAQIQDAPSVDFAAPAPPVPPVSPAATNG